MVGGIASLAFEAANGQQIDEVWGEIAVNAVAMGCLGGVVNLIRKARGLSGDGSRGASPTKDLDGFDLGASEATDKVENALD